MLVNIELRDDCEVYNSCSVLQRNFHDTNHLYRGIAL